MLTFRFVAKIVRVATYSTQFVFPYQQTFRDFMAGAAQKFSLHQSALGAINPIPTMYSAPARVCRFRSMVKPAASFASARTGFGRAAQLGTAAVLALGLTVGQALAQQALEPPTPIPDSDQPAAPEKAESDDPVARALRQRLQAWSQRNGSDAKTVFDDGQSEESRAAAAALSEAKQARVAEAEGQSVSSGGSLPDPENGADPEQLPAPTSDEDREAVAAASDDDPDLAQPNAVETQSLTGDRELDAMLSDSQKLLLVQAIQTLQVINKEDEQARQLAATLTEKQKQALLKLLRTLEDVQAAQAEGQRGFTPDQRAAVVDVLETLEGEQIAIERARERAQQRAAAQKAAAAQAAQAGANQAASAQGLSGGLLNAEQEAALNRGLEKLRAAQRVQAEGGDAQAALNMSAAERQALLAVIQLIEGLREQLGDQASASNLREEQKQALVAAVTRLQEAQRQRDAAPTTQTAAAGATGNAAATNAQARPSGPLNGGLLATLGDKRDVNADLALEGPVKDASMVGRHKTLLYTTLRAPGSVQTGVNYRSGTMASGPWEANFGIDVSGEISSLLDEGGPVGNYRIVPDATVMRRLTNTISLKAAAQGEFVKNAGAVLGSLGLVYSRGNTEVTGNIFGKYEYLAMPDLPDDNPMSFVDATTFGADIGAARTDIILGPTSTDISAKVTLSHIIDRDPTLAFASKAITKLTSEMSLGERVAKARSEFIQQIGASAYGPRSAGASPITGFDDIFAPEGQSAAPRGPIVRRGDDIFSPEGAVIGEQTRDLVAELRGLDLDALPYDLREETIRNFITQLIRLGYSDAKTLELSLDRNAAGLITGRASARLPQIFTPSVVGEARLSYAGQFVPAGTLAFSNDSYIQELGGRLMAAWQAAERTTLAGQVNASVSGDFALKSTAVALEATQAFAPYASASLRVKNTNSYLSGRYLQSLNELRASLRVRDDVYGEFEGSIGREFDGDLTPGAFVAAAAYAKGVRNVLKTGRDAVFEAGLELRYDPALELDPQLGAFVKATFELN